MLTSSTVTIVAVVVVFVWPEFAFQYLMSVATIAAIINWSMIMITQLKFRRRIGTESALALKFRLPFARVTPWIVLAFFAALVTLMCFHPGYRLAVIVGPIWVTTLLVAYEIKRRRRASGRSAA